MSHIICNIKYLPFTLLFVLLLISCTDENIPPKYHIISHGEVDAVVITIHGWQDNEAPCKTLEKFMNARMEDENDFHRFTCVNDEKAREISSR